MSVLYLYLKDKEVHIEIDKIHLRYMAPLCLRGFQKVVSYNNSCGLITVLCNMEYSDGSKEIEEDYIDVKDILNEYQYNADELIHQITGVKIKTTDVELTKQYLINNAIMVSDSIAFIVQPNSSTRKAEIVAISINKLKARAVIDLESLQVLSSNMSNGMLNRTMTVLRINKQQIINIANAEKEGVCRA
jgi:hypothetical protein